jgi:hypothetical protein
MRFFADLAAGNAPPRPAWVPLIDALAASMEGCAPEALAEDATRWANAAPRAARLVSADAVAVGFLLPAWCAPAFSAQHEEPANHPRVAALIETAHRLVETVHPERDVVVALTGPATLARHALGAAPDRVALDALKPGLVKTLEKLCACRPDMIVLDEDLAQSPFGATPDVRRFCNTLKNVTEYFGVALGLRVGGYDSATAVVEELGALKIEHLLLGTPAAGAPPCLTPDLARAAQDAGWRSLGVPVSDASAAAPDTAGLPCYYITAEQDADAERLRQHGARLAG